jgi:PPOX class probable FMN-dependent enzyme
MVGIGLPLPGTMQEIAMEGRFEEIITTRERLRQVKGAPGPRAVVKEIDRIDDICRRFIAACPFIVIATRGEDGKLSVSPKGDPAGFVTVLDENTLAIPDRPGNRRLDTFENLLTHPEIGLFFLIPGNGDALRIGGKGYIVRDAELQNKFVVNGKAPELVLVVSVENAFMHCPKCVIRSKLWKPDQWPDRSNVPTFAEALVAHAALGDTVPEMQAYIDRDAATRLY